MYDLKRWGRLECEWNHMNVFYITILQQKQKHRSFRSRTLHSTYSSSLHFIPKFYSMCHQIIFSFFWNAKKRDCARCLIFVSQPKIIYLLTLSSCSRRFLTKTIKELKSYIWYQIFSIFKGVDFRSQRLSSGGEIKR